jgi:hypothetical protein
MPRRRAARSDGRSPARTRRHRFAPRRLWPNAGSRRRWWRSFRRASALKKIVVGAALVLTLSLCVNWIYQVIRKPTELFFPVSETLYKTPSETWRVYSPIFRRYTTRVITADLLAAIAQVEGTGNPVVRTYWRWSWTTQPFEIYRPASSAVGMYQMTDATFTQAKHYCILNHIVVEDGPSKGWHSCWLNSLYARVIPSHAVELTAAYLDRSVASILGRHRLTAATLQHKQDLAALIHLCGAGAGDAFAGRGFQATDDQRCGEHIVRVYLAQVNAMKRVFHRLDVSSDPSTGGGAG